MMRHVLVGTTPAVRRLPRRVVCPTRYGDLVPGTRPTDGVSTRSLRAHRRAVSVPVVTSSMHRGKFAAPSTREQPVSGLGCIPTPVRRRSTLNWFGHRSRSLPCVVNGRHVVAAPRRDPAPAAPLVHTGRRSRMPGVAPSSRTDPGSRRRCGPHANLRPHRAEGDAALGMMFTSDLNTGLDGAHVRSFTNGTRIWITVDTCRRARPPRPPARIERRRGASPRASPRPCRRTPRRARGSAA